MSEAKQIRFDQDSKALVSTASQLTHAPLPNLDGTLLTDNTSLQAASEDFGHLVHRKPIAVLEPGSYEDVGRMVEFARNQGIKLGARSGGNSVYGQSQVEGGILINLRPLVQPANFSTDRVEVSAGMTWSEVLAASLKRGLRPPVLTHNVELSVGGTLSVGGMDGGSYLHGAQVDNVLELQVVTGDGRLQTCSQSVQPELFDAVLAGMGQCAVILRATLRLIPAGTHARVYELLYRDLNSMLADERLLVEDGRIDRISGYVFPTPSGRWSYYIQADTNFSPPKTPDREILPAGLQYLKGFERITTQPYFDFVANNPRQAALKASGRIMLPHPWIDVFVPDEAADQYLADTFGKLTPADIGVDFPISFFFIKKAACKRPLLRLPDSHRACLFNLMTTITEPKSTQRMLDQNQKFFEQARAIGGKHLPVSAIKMEHEDWVEHYGLVWDQFARAKRQFDPENILSPGPGIFQGLAQPKTEKKAIEAKSSNGAAR